MELVSKCKTIVELEVDISSDLHQSSAALHNSQDEALHQLHILLSRIALIDRSAVEQIVDEVEGSAELEDDLTIETDEETKAMRELGLPVRFVARESRIKRAETQSDRQKLRANRGKREAVNNRTTRRMPVSEDGDLTDEIQIKDEQDAVDDDCDDREQEESSDDAYWHSLRAAFDRAYSDLEHDAGMPLGELISKRYMVEAWGEAAWRVLGAYLSSATWLWLYAAWMTTEDRRAQARQLDADRAALCAVLQSVVEDESESVGTTNNEPSDALTCASTEYWNAVWRRHCECVRTHCLSLQQPKDSCVLGQQDQAAFEVDQLDGTNDGGHGSDADGDGKCTQNDAHDTQPAAPDTTQQDAPVLPAEALGTTEREPSQASGADTSGSSNAAVRRRMRVAKSAQLWTNVANKNVIKAPLKRDGERTFNQVLHSLAAQGETQANVKTDATVVTQKQDAENSKHSAPARQQPTDATRVKSTFRQLGFVWHGATGEPQHDMRASGDCKEVQSNVDCEFDALLSNIRSFKCRSKQLAKARKLGHFGRGGESAACCNTSADPVPQADADGERKRKKVTEKYRAQRYRLFSRFDRGVQLDDESWWSVTPEQIARHHAERCACDVIVDACCGVGGNAIQFARTCSRVLAFDIDSQRLHMARHNSRLYDDQDAGGGACSSKVELVCGDFVQFVKTARVNNVVDVVFLDLPWGGPQYLQTGVFDLDTMRLETVEDGRRVHLTVTDLFRMVAQRLTSSIALFAPRNCDMQQLVALARFTGGQVELEQNMLNGKLKTVTAYYGALVKT